MINPTEEYLRRLTFIKARTRVLIDTTSNFRKKEMYRKKHEQISFELDNLLKTMKIE